MCLWLQLDLSGNQLCGVYFEYGELRGTYTSEGFTAIVNALKVTPSVTSVDVLFNQLDVDSADLLLKVKVEKPNLRTLCGLTHEETELDLSFRSLGPGDAKLLAPEISVIGSLTSLDISNNQLTGDYLKEMTGVIAIAEALKGNASLTKCNLRLNSLGVEGWTIIFNALRDSPTSKITMWDLSYEHLGPEIAKPLAEYISVSASLTFMDVSGNSIGEEGMRAVGNALLSRGTSKLGAFKCDAFALPVGTTSLDLSGKRISSAAAIMLAGVIKFNASVTKVLVGGNKLGDAGATILCDALRESKVTKVQELDLSKNNINLDGAKAVVAMAAVVASLTSVR